MGYIAGFCHAKVFDASNLDHGTEAVNARTVMNKQKKLSRGRESAIIIRRRKR